MDTQEYIKEIEESEVSPAVKAQVIELLSQGEVTDEILDQVSDLIDQEIEDEFRDAGVILDSEDPEVKVAIEEMDQEIEEVEKNIAEDQRIISETLKNLEIQSTELDRLVVEARMEELKKQISS
ncbi:MAG: hypothetical protein M3Q34_00165 [bacterium]|nr:hypothetical protein [bacterium]